MRSIRFSVWDAVALLSLGAADMATWTVYDRLPNPIPTHFDIHGNPNGWMSRSVGAWFVPAFALVLWAIVRFAPLVLPRRDKHNMKEAVPVAAMMTTVFMSAVHVAILWRALNPNANVTQIVFVMMSLFFVGLGLVMPRIKRNPIIGVRTPWTLTSEENWARTHRVAGYSMVVGGILGGLCAMVGGVSATVLSLLCFAGAGIVPAVWSLLYARRHDPS